MATSDNSIPIMIVPLFITREHACHFEIIMSHDCWCGCHRCKGAGCVVCEGKGFFDKGRVERKVSASWNEPDFSDLEIVGSPECCPDCGMSFKEMVEEWLEKRQGSEIAIEENE